tara:strand:+ start:43 stop:360 length:318 start_codon:yes stop_codon:yes gene_type:complete
MIEKDEKLVKEKAIALKKKINNAMMLLGFIGTLATVPTIIKVFYTHPQHISSHSLTTWGFYTFIALCWIFYGIYFRMKAIIVINSLYLLVDGIIVYGLIMEAIQW